MALFGNDRPILPTFRTTPELDSSAPSPYDDLNRIARNVERNVERNGRNLDRNQDRDPRDERTGRDRNERMELDRELERRAERDAERAPDRGGERSSERTSERSPERGSERQPQRAVDLLEPVLDTRSAAAPGRPVAHEPNPALERTHPLIQGLFDKLPQAESEWSLQARQKWLQTAANIFDLMYLPNESDAGELAIRVERPSAR